MVWIGPFTFPNSLLSKKNKQGSRQGKPKIYDTSDEKTWLELRRRNINLSEVAALFGMSPYLTEYELWNIKAGELKDGFVSNDRVEAGQFLEAGIAAWAAHKKGFA